MNTIREISKINQQELERGIAGTPASWHHQYANSAWCYVGNLDHELTEGDVLCIMSQFGEVEDIHLVREEDTGKSRGFGFVKYEDARSCVLAVDNFVGSQILGRSIRVDHVEQYRLPKKLQEQEEEQQQQKQQIGGAGHAYEGKELENKYDVSKGVDLFAPPSSGGDSSDDSQDGNHDDKEAKQRRKEERRQKRQEKEERRREREKKRERKEEKKRRKRAHQYDDNEQSGVDGSKEKKSHEKKHKKKKRKHDKHSYLPMYLAHLSSTIILLAGYLSTHVLALHCPTTSIPHRTPPHSRQSHITPLRASRRSDAPVAVNEELGCSPTLTLLLNQQEPFFFDPLNLATDENFATYREAELKHGRVAMISVVSCVSSTILREIEKVNQEGKLQQLWKSVFAPSKANADSASADSVVVTIPSDPRQLLPVPSPMELLQDWSPWDYARMILVCGLVETFVWVQTDPQDMPGDYQLGYLGVRDKGLHERSLISELENGRLAMMVMLYYFALDLWSVDQPILIQQLVTTGAAE